MVINVDLLFDEWRHPAMVGSLEGFWVLQEVMLFINYSLLGISMVLVNIPLLKPVTKFFV
jgi:hypothetical protein